MNIHYTSFLKHTLYLCSLMSFMYCSFPKKTSTGSESDSFSTNNSATFTDNILFLTLKMVKDSTNQTGEMIYLVDKQNVNGRLKTKIAAPQTINKDDLICEFLDKKNTVLATQIVEDPLTASIEYPDDDNSFKRVFLGNKEADLFLRVQYNVQLYKLRLSKVLSNGKIQLITHLLIKI
jgi:hypothetical protein